MEFEKIVHLEKAGTLSKYINYRDKRELKSLKITGELNAKDVDDVLDDMCSSEGNYVGDAPNDEWVTNIEDSPKLRILDMSECRYVDGDNFSYMGWYTLLEYLAFPQGITDVCDEDDTGYKCAANLHTIILPDGLKIIRGFNGCENLTNITLPESIEEIGNYAFTGCCKLTKLHIPRNVKNISGDAFSQTGIVSFDLDNNNPYFTVVDGVLFSKDLKTLVAFSAATLQHYDIPCGTETIGAGAFYGCNLDTITIPDTVMSIKMSAFECSGLHEISIPDSVTEIGDLCFRGCSEMKSIRLPQKITRLGYIISSCKKLKELDIPASVKQLSMENIVWSESLEHVYFHDGLKEITGVGPCFCSRGHIKEIRFPKTLHRLPGGMFHYSPDIKKFDIDSENPYMTVVDGALYSKDMRKLIAVPDCHRKAFTIPEGVEEIGIFAFMNFPYIESITLPSTLKRVGHRVFDGCKALKTFCIPASVIEIDFRAFDGCKKLQRITCMAEKPPKLLDRNPHWKFLHDCKKLIIEVPHDSLTLYRDTPGWNEVKLIEI